MYSSKIEQLKQSTFRQGREDNWDSKKRSFMGSRNTQEEIDASMLAQYQLKMPVCPYHHKPIRYLCLKKQCKSSGFGLCGSEECRKMHADPDVDLIELGKFNQLVRDDCASIQMVMARMKKYFRSIKQELIHKIDLSIQRALFVAEINHTPQVLRLIKNKKNNQLDSAKLATFVQRQLNEATNIRAKMQILRNKVSDRIKIKDLSLEKLIKSTQYDQIMLSDLLVGQQIRTGDMSSRIHVGQLNSSILSGPEETQIMTRLLRQNRAVSFSKINLIFRASEHNFDSKVMHQAVDTVSPTLLLVKSTTGRKFGAYINCKINSKQQWISDVSGLSFLFSIDRQESYRLKAEAGSRLKAVFGGTKGVQIGSGCDLYLTQSCHLYKKSGANLGGSYKLPPHLQFNTPPARSYLAGEQLFQVQDYEFFFLE